jgi:hypothetical protein
MKEAQDHSAARRTPHVARRTSAIGVKAGTICPPMVRKMPISLRQELAAADLDAIFMISTSQRHHRDPTVWTYPSGVSGSSVEDDRSRSAALWQSQRREV